MSKEEIQKIVKQELEIYNFDDPFDYERASLNITDKLSNRLEKLVMPKIAEEKLRQMFRDNSDCYADTWIENNSGYMTEGDVVQAMTEDKFIGVISKISNFSV